MTKKKETTSHAMPDQLVYEEVIKLFPEPYAPRDLQREVIRDVITSYNKGDEFVVLEVPVGAGKSFIAATLGRAFGDSAWYLTLTEQLQRQYTKDFEGSLGFRPLLGRNKFSCSRGGGMTCAEGKHLTPPCSPAQCPYQRAKVEALMSPHTVANLHSYYFNVGLGVGRKRRRGDPLEDFDPPSDPMRNLLVVDECHKLEEFLLEQSGVTVNMEKLSALVSARFPVLPNSDLRDDDDEDATEYFDYIEKHLLPVVERYQAQSKSRGTLDLKTADELKGLIEKFTFVLQNKDLRWVPERGTDEKTRRRHNKWFSLKPLYVDVWGPRMYTYGRFKIFMSGTVLDPGVYCQSLGLDPSKGSFFTYDSPFPAENRPIWAGNLDMSYGARSESWPQMVQMVNQLMKDHANQKGLLLVPSNKMLDYIMNGDPRAGVRGIDTEQKNRIIKAVGDDRVEQYERHVNSSAPTVLAASGYWEGADLKGSASEFQIIPQVPRPMFQGQIRARAKRSNKWYKLITWMKMLQGLGRSLRTETDVAVTYVFDRDFRREFEKKKDSLMPQWVKSSVRIVPDADD